MEHEYKKITCKSACNKVKRSLPYKWDLNIYRGCTHRCKYCYALYSHKYLGSDDFFEEVYVKTNIIDQLEKQLNNPSWKNEVISMGTVCDSYQPIEEQLEIMPQIIELLIKHKNPAIISTKSDLVLRDLDLINELSEITYINIAGSITAIDEDLRLAIEPNAKHSKNRITMLKKIRKETNASTGLHIMPIVPYLTDSYENLEAIFREGKLANVHYILPGTLNLYGKTKSYFFKFIKQDFPDVEKDIKYLYRTGRVDRKYNQKLYKTIAELKIKYDVSTNYMKTIEEKLKSVSNETLFKDGSKQTTLFD